jgi:hypothetical protein
MLQVIYGHETDLRTAIHALRELANDKLRYASTVTKELKSPDGEGLHDMALRTANHLFSTANSLEQAVHHNYEQPTFEEEKQELHALLDDLHSLVSFRHAGTLAEQFASMIDYLKRQRSQAFGLAATIADEQRVKLEAMRWMLKSALASPTHASKNRRLELALEATEEILNELQKIDPDQLSGLSTPHWEVGSWNTRRLQSDVYQKEKQIQQLKARIESLSSHPNQEEELNA